MAPSHLLLVVASCGAILSLAPVIGATTFMFNSRSKVVRDDHSGRIRGIQSRENKSFVLGGLFPIHFPSADSSSASPCGVVWPQVLEWVEAMLYAMDRINGDPDLLPGVELGYDIRDTCLSETLGLDEAIDLIITGSNLNIASCQAEFDPAKLSPNESGPGVYPVPTSGIVGAAGSRVSVPVASLGRLFNMPQVSYASTSPLLNDQTRYSYFRRTIPSDDLQVQAMVDILHRFSWNYVSVLHSEDTYGSAGVNEFVRVSAINGICIDLRRGIQPSLSATEYNGIVEDLGNSRAKVVVFFAIQDAVREVLTRIHENETLRNRFLWIASDGWAHATNLVHQFNETAAGMFGVAPLTQKLGDLDDYLSQLTINSNLRNAWFPEFLATIGNCTVGDDCDNDTDIVGPSFQQDVFTPLVVDAVYAYANALHNFLVDNCNETENAPFRWFKENRTCFGQSRELNGASLLEYLSDVNFKSITNHSIVFDESGSVQGFYEILNYQAVLKINVKEYHVVSVGTWVGSNVSEQLMLKDDKDLQFGVNSDGSLRNMPIQSECGGCLPGTQVRNIPESCCDICDPCLGGNYSSEELAMECSSCLVDGEREMWGNSPFTGSNSCVLIPETSAMYSDPWAIPSLFFACVGLISVAATAVIFGIYWKTPIVKSSSREQMILLLIGITCSFLLPFFYVAPPSIPICLVNRLGIWFCYSLMFGALAIKAQRIARIFYGVKRNLLHVPRFSTPIYQVIFTLIIVAIQMVLVVVSLAVVHPEVQRMIRYDQNSKGGLGLPEVVIVCRKEETAVVALSLLYETCIIAVATILGIFSFKFPKNFNEAKYISFCTFSLLVVWLGLIPAYFTTESRPEIQNAAISLFIILSAFGVLCFIFGPKLFIAVFHPSKNRFTTTHHHETEPGTEIKQQSL